MKAIGWFAAGCVAGACGLGGVMLSAAVVHRPPTPAMPTLRSNAPELADAVDMQVALVDVCVRSLHRFRPTRRPILPMVQVERARQQDRQPSLGIRHRGSLPLQFHNRFLQRRVQDLMYGRAR